MVVVDEAFKGAGKKVGIEIWRINKFKVTVLPREEYGSFFSGDSYIVLSTKKVNSEWDVHFWLGNETTLTEGVGDKLIHNIFYWLGDETTPDEMGTAAIKTVELDDLLGGGPVQYREVQEHESSLFMSYFKNGIRYMKGGHDSGFKHVGDPKFETRLFQCKGKHNVRVRQVPLSPTSLNRGDVFILDAGLNIYVWMPPDSGRCERIKGMNMALDIRDHERSGRAEVVVVDTAWETADFFYSKLGDPGRKISIKTAQEGGSDEEFMQKVKPHVSLWRVSDASGELKVTKVAEGELSIKMLDSKDAFILDAGIGGIFVWIGKQCTTDERSKGMKWAMDYLKQAGLPSCTSVVRVLDTAEPEAFRQWFKDAAITEITPHMYHCSDESGKFVVHEISRFTQENLDFDDVMILDTGDTIFVWIGVEANAKEKKAAEATARKFLSTNTLPRPPGGAKVTIVKQGEEPESFKRQFGKWDPILAKMQKTVDDVKKLILTGPHKK